MKKLLLTALLLCPLFGHSQVTTGYHRISQVLARAPQSVTAKVVPGASVFVTSTLTGSTALIYADPLLTVPIGNGVVTADSNGNYNYYIALNYCVNESISSPGQGTIVNKNICNLSGSGLGPGCSLNADVSITGTTFTTSFCVMQPVGISTTLHGECAITWEQATAAATVSFGVGMNNAPTDFWVTTEGAQQSTSNPQYTIQTATAASLIGSAFTPSTAATPYIAKFYFGIQTGGTNPVTVTFYGLTSNGSDALVIKAGSGCSWLP